MYLKAPFAGATLFGQRFSIEQLEDDEGIVNGEQPEDNAVTEQVYQLT